MEAAHPNPKHTTSDSNHGLLLASQGKYPEAEVESRKTLEFNASYLGARSNLG